MDFVDITEDSFKAEDYLGITYEEAMGNMHVIGENNKVITFKIVITMRYWWIKKYEWNVWFFK